MNFDINTVLTDMLSAIKGSVENDWDKVQPVANQFLQRDKDRIQLLAELRINGELNEDKFQSRLSDQKQIIEAELNALAVLSKVIAQNAANAVIDVLEKAITVAIKTAI
jgi:hypothetical protein